MSLDLVFILCGCELAATRVIWTFDGGMRLLCYIYRSKLLAISFGSKGHGILIVNRFLVYLWQPWGINTNRAMGVEGC